MGCFPLFIELAGRPCLVAGGGKVALRKVQKLLPFGPHITVVAPSVCPQLAAVPGVRFVRRRVRVGDLRRQTLVIAATDDAALNRRIAAACRARHIPVNVVDNPDAGSFIFPALARRGPLTVGVCTGGASPVAAAWVKRQIEAVLPEETFGPILTWLADCRQPVKAALASETTRAALFARLFDTCMEKGRPLTDEEFAALLDQAKTEENTHG